MNNTIKVIDFAKELRKWCKENLPVYESVVAYDLILLLASKFLKREAINVKYIYSMLPHSYTAIRQHYKHIIKDGWIECIEDEMDKRVKRIIPTKKFNSIIFEYAKFITENAPSNQS